MTQALSTLPLVAPLTVGDKVISELSVRRPKVRDLREVEAAGTANMTEFDRAIAMAQRLCDLPDGVVEEMDAADFAALSEIIAGFLAPGPGKGSGEA
jgi:hypothetical protein